MIDGGRVCHRYRCSENAITVGHAMVHLVDLFQSRHEGGLVECAVGKGLPSIAADVADDFQRDVAQWPAHLFDSRLWIVDRYKLSKKLSSFLEHALLRGWLSDISSFREGIEMSNERLQVVVVHVRLELQLVFQRDGECGDEVETAYLGEKVALAQVGIFRVTLFDVKPDYLRYLLRCCRNVRPFSTAIIEASMSGGAAEADCQTHESTDDRYNRSVEFVCVL